MPTKTRTTTKRKTAKAKGGRAKATKTTTSGANKKADKKLSALDAAAKVLAQSSDPLTTKQMVEAMSAKKYWKSPGGKTPHATLYSAILREINVKGSEARFKKTERGKFTSKA